MILQFILAPSISSRLVGYFGSDYKGGFSHVSAVLPSGLLLDSRSDKVGGQPPGVHIRPDNYEKWIRKVRVHIPSTFEQDVIWETFLYEQLNKPYDKKAILGFILGTPLHSKDHWICSALQFEALIQCGKLYSNPEKSFEVSPDNLFLLVTSGLGGKQEVII